jgi:hypothetical protein
MEDATGPGPVEDHGDGAVDGGGAVESVGGGGAGESRAGPAESGAADGTEATGLPDDTTDGPDDGSEVRDPLRFNNWMKRSATGAVMTGIAVGLQQALQLPRQEPAFVIEASGEPHDPNRAIDLHFDPDNPADTVAIIRRPVPVDPPEEPSPPA